MREDVYKAKVTAANLHKMGACDALSAEQKQPVDKMLLDGKRAGLALEKKEDKELLKRLKDDLSDACLKFTVCTFLCGYHRWSLKHASSRSKTLTRSVGALLFVSPHRSI